MISQSRHLKPLQFNLEIFLSKIGRLNYREESEMDLPVSEGGKERHIT